MPFESLRVAIRQTDNNKKIIQSPNTFWIAESTWDTWRVNVWEIESESEREREKKMATPPESPVEEVVYELETTRTPKPIPVALEDLCRQTKFTRQEIRVMYRGFKTVCFPVPVACVHVCVCVCVLFWLNAWSTLDFNYFICAFRCGWKLQECPEGVVLEDSFKDIYAKFFPHGSKCDAINLHSENLFTH